MLGEDAHAAQLVVASIIFIISSVLPAFGPRLSRATRLSRPHQKSITPSRKGTTAAAARGAGLMRGDPSRARAMGAVGASGAPGVAGESRRAAVVAVRHAPAATAGGGELE